MNCRICRYSQFFGLEFGISVWAQMFGCKWNWCGSRVWCRSRSGESETFQLSHLRDFDVFQKCLDSKIDDMCETCDMVFLSIPIHLMGLVEKIREFLAHCIVVGGVISRNTKQLFADTVYGEDFMQMVCKINSTMTPVDFSEIKKILLKNEVLIDVMACNSYDQHVQQKRIHTHKFQPICTGPTIQYQTNPGFITC